MKNIKYYLIVLIGFLQIIGYLTKLDNIRNLGWLTSASPLPIVFTEMDGVETFAADFYLQWDDENCEQKRIKITPEMYSKLKGPYNRRNIYGAAIAGGPVIAESLWQPVLNYGLCNNILTDELQIPVTENEVSVYVTTRTKHRNDYWTLNTSCK